MPVNFGGLAGAMIDQTNPSQGASMIPGTIPGRGPLTSTSMPMGGGSPPMPPPGAAGPQPAGPQGAAGMPGAPGGANPQIISMIYQALQRAMGRPPSNQEVMQVLMTMQQQGQQGGQPGGAPGMPAPMGGPGMTGMPPAPPPPSTSGLLRS